MIDWACRAPCGDAFGSLTGSIDAVTGTQELLEKAGFEVVHFEVEPATAEDYKELDRIKVAACFQRFSREELAARHLFFVARKP